MKKVFVDLGAYDGDTVREFYNWGKLTGDPNEYDIYMFEPNPKFADQLRKMAEGNGKLFYSNKAAWLKDGEIEFAVDNTDTPMGSTAEQSKLNIWDTMPHIKVESFDFSEWVKQFKDDYLLVKMDIEGAEFPVLEKMLKDDTVSCIDKLLCEFHPNKATNYTTNDKINLIDRLSKFTIVKEWH